MKKTLLTFLIILILSSAVFAQQTVTLTTYYPAPYGAYDRLRLVPRAELAVYGTVCTQIGTMYVNQRNPTSLTDTIYFCMDDGTGITGTWVPLPGVWTRNGNNIFPTDMRSGTTDDRATRIILGGTTPGLKLTLRNEALSQTGGDAGIYSWTSFIDCGIPDLCGGDALPAAFNGPGRKFFWYPRQAAFRAGRVNAFQWDDANIGRMSVAMGIDTIASGEGSIALGQAAQATGARSIALGAFSAVASGTESIAMMNGQATGNRSVAIGLGDGPITAQAFGSMAIGRHSVLAGNLLGWVATDPLFAIGNGATAATRHNALTILKNGRVGIGAATPRQWVDIEAAVAAGTTTPFLQFTNTHATDVTGRPSLDWFVDSTANDFTAARMFAEAGTSYQNSKLYVQVANSARVLQDRLTIDRDGRVGIGTTTPSGSLHLHTTTSEGGDIFFTDAGVNVGTNDPSWPSMTAQTFGLISDISMGQTPSGHDGALFIYGAAEGMNPGLMLWGHTQTPGTPFGYPAVSIDASKTGPTGLFAEPAPTDIVLGINYFSDLDASNEDTTVLVTYGGNVGIGFDKIGSKPTQRLHIKNAMKLEPTSVPPDVCDAAHPAVAGTIYVDSWPKPNGKNTLCYCDGVGWENIGGDPTGTCN